MTKAELRKIYLARQKNISPPDRSAQSLIVADAFFARFDLSGVKYLHSFLPIEKFNEIDTRLILNKIWRDFPAVTTLVPRVDLKTFEMESLVYRPETELVQNSWQIHEPVHDETIAPAEIDAVLVPLLCFDRRGYRVGYGKGFYDRFLSRCRPDCQKIGLNYFAPVERITDADDFDAALNYCITPGGIYDF